MKVAIKRRKPLQKSHTITQAKVNNGQKFQTVSIKKPVEEMTTQHADDDDDAAVSYMHIVTSIVPSLILLHACQKFHVM